VRSVPPFAAVRLALTLALLMLAVCPLTGCRQGERARDFALVPALVLSADGFESDVRAGVAALPAADRPDATLAADAYFEAVRSGDRARMVAEGLVRWAVVRDLALAGINAKQARGEIGPFGAESLRNRVLEVGVAMDRLRAAPPVF